MGEMRNENITRVGAVVIERRFFLFRGPIETSAVFSFERPVGGIAIVHAYF